MTTPLTPWIAEAKPHGPGNVSQSLVSFDARDQLGAYAFVHGLKPEHAATLEVQVNLAPGLVSAVQDLAGMLAEIDRDPMPVTSYVTGVLEEAAVRQAVIGTWFEIVDLDVPALVMDDIEELALFEGLCVAVERRPDDTAHVQVTLQDHEDLIRALENTITDATEEAGMLEEAEAAERTQLVPAYTETVAAAALSEEQAATVARLYEEAEERTRRQREIEMRRVEQDG